MWGLQSNMKPKFDDISKSVITYSSGAVSCHLYTRMGACPCYYAWCVEYGTVMLVSLGTLVHGTVPLHLFSRVVLCLLHQVVFFFFPINNGLYRQRIVSMTSAQILVQVRWHRMLSLKFKRVRCKHVVAISLITVSDKSPECFVLLYPLLPILSWLVTPSQL